MVFLWFPIIFTGDQTCSKTRDVGVSGVAECLDYRTVGAYVFCACDVPTCWFGQTGRPFFLWEASASLLWLSLSFVFPAAKVCKTSKTRTTKSRDNEKPSAYQETLKTPQAHACSTSASNPNVWTHDSKISLCSKKMTLQSQYFPSFSS